MSSPISDFINLSSQLLKNIKMLCSNNSVETYFDICNSFINKHPQEYLKMYKSYIYIKKKEIAEFNYSIFKENKDWSITLSENEKIINADKIKSVFDILFKEWNEITENNKNAIFTYLKYMNDIIDRYNI